MSTFTLASKVKTVYGVELPWEERENYDVPAYPDTCPKHSPVPEELKYANPRCTCHPRAKGDLIDQGTVFVPLSTLESVCERTTDDYWSGVTPPIVGHREGLALEQAGLAERETRGGYHGTDAGRQALNDLWHQYPDESDVRGRETA